MYTRKDFHEICSEKNICRNFLQSSPIGPRVDSHCGLCGVSS